MVFAYFIPALRILLGLLFIITSAMKFPNLRGFSVIVASYNLVPRKLVKPVAYLQPIIEFIVGWWILWGQYLLYSATAGLVLMLVADVFVIKGFLQKKKMENCGCYGTAIKVPLTGKKVAENILWTALFVILILGAKEMAGLGLV